MTGIEAIKEQLRVQGSEGNWNYDPYMHGMYNGLECALATLEEREPDYKEAPEKWLKGTHGDESPVADIPPSPPKSQCHYRIEGNG